MSDNELSVDIQSLTNKNWKLKEYSDRQIDFISQKYGLSRLVSKLLNIRNISEQDIPSYINPSLKESLPDPYNLVDMEKSCNRLYQAILANEKIAVFGDYDVDGSTSASLLINYFKKLSIDLDFHIPNRFTEGYGPSKEVFSKFKDKGIKVIFTVDCGTMSHEEIEFANQNKLDIIVLDHHQPEINLPKAFALINPNRLDDTSGLNYLAAVGVTYMFIIGINRKLRKEGWFKKNDIEEPNLISFLDVAALGTVCDAVPLKGLNRILVNKGLEVMQKLNNPGLRALAEKSNIKQKVSVYDLGFKLGPRINAAGRLGRSSFGTDLLTASQKLIADQISEELNKFNSERRTIESYVLDQAIEQVTEDKLKNKVLIVYGEGWHEGVIGIIASRLKDKFNKPTIVFSINDNVAKGSGRSLKGIDLGSLVVAAQQSQIILKGGGHAMAAGLTMEKNKIDELSQFFEKKLNKVDAIETNFATMLADDKLSISAVNLEVHDEIEKVGPFGSENPEPNFIFENIKLASVDQIGEDHLKCLIKSNESSFIEAMAFRSLNTKLGDELKKNKGGNISIFGKIKINEWNGRKTPQLHIIDIANSQIN